MLDLNFEPSLSPGWDYEGKEERAYTITRWFRHRDTGERFAVKESTSAEYRYPWDITISEYNPEKFIDILLCGYDDNGKLTVKIKTWGTGWRREVEREVKNAIEEFNLKEPTGVYRYESFFSKDGEYGSGTIQVIGGEIILTETEERGATTRKEVSFSKKR